MASSSNSHRRPRLTTDENSSSNINVSPSIACGGASIIDDQIPRLSPDAVRCKFALYGRQHAHVDHFSSVEHETKEVLQSTMVLQEDGRLAAKLDHVSYLLDGLLESCHAPRMHHAQTRSLLELLHLIQEPQILQIISLSRVRGQMKKLLLFRLTTAPEEETARLSMAVLVYFLSHCAAEDYFDNQVLTAIVHALKQEIQGERDEKKDTIVSHTRTSVKRCLKRKQIDEKVTLLRSTYEVSTMQDMDAMCRMKLEKLLQDHEVFHAGEELHVSVISALCASLLKLLQPNASALFNLMPPHRQQSSDVVGIFERKCLLMRTGGLNILTYELIRQVQGLKNVLSTTVANDVGKQNMRSLHIVNLVLNLLGQAACQAVDVKHYLSKQQNLFFVLLQLVKLLSDLSWYMQAQRMWNAAPSSLSLAVEVLLSTIRVLINLTHHESEAASNIHALDGMQILVSAFSSLCKAASAEESWMQKSWGFDACLLLLSVLVNCIEFSEENRVALAEVSVCRIEGTNLAEHSACALFVEFFLSKVQSFKHLIEGSEAQVILIDEDDDWNPEDVILGGCTSLLLGLLMKDSAANGASILKLMPGSSSRLLLCALRVYVAFHSQINALTPDLVESVLMIEKILKSFEGSDQRDLLESVTVTNKVTSVDLRASKAARSNVPRLNRAQPLKNVCSLLDDSDDDFQSHIQSLASASDPLSTKETFGKSMIQKSFVSVPDRKDACRSSPIAIRPNDSISSSSVVRLLKRTRQLVEEFDTQFASSNLYKKRDVSEKRATATEVTGSLSTVVTMNVTCRDNGNDDLHISQDITGTNVETIGTTKVDVDQKINSAMPWKRKKKSICNTTTDAVLQQTTMFDIISGSPPPTPLRIKQSKELLETPTRSKLTFDLFRRSPSLNLTPKKLSPATPVWTRRASGLLQTSKEKNESTLQKDSLVSVIQRQRKVKTGLFPTSICNSSVFDFTD
ncbi:uncharacterized protein PHALS_04700 [Plasmopara halstedii]|uniref:Uncharacterized protein n=1 Tax=Plasmopara halstedii TaxID=4781 RepID=A0A0P1A9H5_PLAHL|nr:uncharacterized protein PHALS_04700 [Plasmopara halstedii]CEG37260.1 hypothetical protein PHALS_04700 [Plasmopara halstedii]|eukprot:XP_024573629.1 hypothetical protein PHALS_04700 [Plasmopara halstedii]